MLFLLRAAVFVGKPRLDPVSSNTEQWKAVAFQLLSTTQQKLLLFLGFWISRVYISISSHDPFNQSSREVTSIFCFWQL